MIQRIDDEAGVGADAAACVEGDAVGCRHAWKEDELGEVAFEFALEEFALLGSLFQLL